MCLHSGNSNVLNDMSVHGSLETVVSVLVKRVFVTAAGPFSSLIRKGSLHGGLVVGSREENNFGVRLSGKN